MNRLHDTSLARFGGWTASVDLPPGKRDPSIKAAEYAYRYLKDLIVTLELPPRAIITEKEVASATDISRTPVREAFFRLQGERLLEIIPRRGAAVPEITLRGITEQAQTRLVLEGYGVESICNRKIPVANDLFKIIEEQEAVYRRDPTQVLEMVLIDKEFHWSLVKAIGNTEFSQLYNTLHDRQVRIGVAMFNAVDGRPCNAIHQHTKIAEAIQDFDAPLALERLEYHLIESLDELTGVFTG